MTVRESLCTGNARYRAAEPLTPQGVVLHSIGTPQPRAQVLRDYWQRDAGPYVVHYVLDDSEAIQCMPENYKCWHVGAPGNSKYLGVEMCEPKQLRYTGGASFTVSDLPAARAYAAACRENAVELLTALCRKYGWEPETAVWTHNELTVRKLSNTDHVDPEHLWKGLGLPYSLEALRAEIRKRLEAGSTGTETPEAPDEAPEAPDEAPEAPIYRVRKTWSDVRGQIGAYRNLEYAKSACPMGFFVFDETGTPIWPPADPQSPVGNGLDRSADAHTPVGNGLDRSADAETPVGNGLDRSADTQKPSFTPYIVYIKPADGLNVRKGPGAAYPIVNVLEQGGAYTIVEESSGWGLLKAYAATRTGWINLAYTERIR